MATQDPDQHQDIRDLAVENDAKDRETRSVGLTDENPTTTEPDEPETDEESVDEPAADE